MKNLFALLQEAARGGFTFGRAAIKVGRTTVKIVIKVFFTP